MVNTTQSNHELTPSVSDQKLDFESVVAQHYAPLFNFALSLTRAEPDARDLTQQTFYIWAKKRHQLRDVSKVKSWLFTTLHRAFLAIRRRNTRFPHDGLDEVPLEVLPSSSAELSNVLDASRVRGALAEVDTVYRAAVALFYLEERSYKEVAEILRIPIGTVKSRLARGLIQLRQIFNTSSVERSLDS